jgi:hypothetical protein
MPAASEIVREYARYHAFILHLNITCPAVECARDWTVAGRKPTLPRGLNPVSTACPDQGIYNERDNVNPFHNQMHISPLSFYYR